MKIGFVGLLAAVFAAASIGQVVAADKSMMKPESASVTMNAQNNSGESGTATLTAKGKKTLVKVDLTGAKGSQPAHIHGGSCAKLNPVPKWPLKPVVNGKSTTTVDAPIDKLTTGKWAVNVHKSAGAGLKTYVSCGDIPKK